jgi:ribosomal protein S18 acetylase RimI-like enzyme
VPKFHLFKKIPETDYPFSGWWFLGVFVNPLYRRMGIGEELMKVAIETVAKEGASTIKSTVFENNIPGIKLSKKLGFQKIYIPDLEKQFQEEYKRGSPKQSVLEKNINNYE